MARTYLFLVHGVGKHAADSWADPWKRVLIDKLRTFAPYSDKTPEEIERESLRCVPISYDSVFETFREDWEDLDDLLSSAAFALGSDARVALDWIASQDAELKRIFWEKVLDVLLWATDPLARAAVIAHVNEQLIRHLVEMFREPGGENRAHIVAHSLGTSVISDSLIALRAERKVHHNVLDTGRFQWRSVTMVANTSRLLEPRFDVSDTLDPDDFKVYHSRLFPGTSSSIVKRYTNVRHVLDPITWPRRFKPVQWTSAPYAEITTEKFDELAGVHDFENYVRNPHVHLPLFRITQGNSRLGKRDEIERALKDLDRDFPNVASTEFPELRALIDPNPDHPVSTRKLVEALVKAFKELR